MKFLSLVVLISLPVLASHPDWKKIENPDMKAFWEHSTNKGATLTIYEDKDTFELKEFDAELYSKELPSVRSMLHMIVGMKDWKINSKEVVKQNDKVTITFQGTYLRTGTNLVHFCEKHEFTSTTFTQTQMMAPKSEFDSLTSDGCKQLFSQSW